MSNKNPFRKTRFQHLMTEAWNLLELEEAKPSPTEEGLVKLLESYEVLKEFVPHISWVEAELEDFMECVEELY